MRIFIRVTKKIPIIGYAVIGGQLIFDDSYKARDAVGDLIGAGPVDE